ncbi:SpoIIIAH-like family protein [Fictibacillus sp. Mic-4]|uniref:SpoIIIAH-like family protein n=1 Tax=Fictibacillus TaxID=1329200 RepID=UPI00041E75B5|nr:SpoIIIAH-like family protein [Fictibacillus gelatini]
MLLKKQTVWLLTMLSLIIVLSVYYILAPANNDDMAYLNKEKDKLSQKEKAAKSNTVELANSGDSFTALRLQRQEDRDKLREHLTTIAASSNVSAEKQAQAQAEIQKLEKLSMKEQTLETLIETMGYKDVLVNTDTDNNQVRIIVKANKKPSAKAAVEIMNKAKAQLGTGVVAVEYQPAK